MLPMRIAARHGDRRHGALREHGAEMDIDTPTPERRGRVRVEKTPDDEALSADVPRLLHHIFDADMRHFHTRDKSVTNRTCMQPAGEGVPRCGSMAYIFDTDSHSEQRVTTRAAARPAGTVTLARSASPVAMLPGD